MAESVRPNDGIIKELQGVRALAALSVIVYHLPPWNPIFRAEFLRSSYLMIDLFFVLSGFVICRAYEQKIHTARELARFQMQRLGRLYPVHFVFLLAFASATAASYLALAVFHGHGFVSYSFGGPAAFFEHIFLLQAMGPTGNELTFNGPAWSISVEFWVYLVFGLTVLLSKKHRTGLYVLFIAIASALMIAGHAFGFTLFLLCATGFFAGCLVAVAVRRLPITLPGWVTPLLLVVFAAYLVLNGSTDLTRARGYDQVSILLSALLTAGITLSAGSGLNRFLCRPLLERVGDLSYSIYMSHMFVIWGTSTLFKRLFRGHLVWVGGERTLAFNLPEAILAAIAVLIVTTAVGQAVHSLIEKPLRDQIRRWNDRWFPLDGSEKSRRTALGINPAPATANPE